jgi:hypothetical protein
MVRLTRFALGKGAITSAPRVGVLLEAENCVVDLATALNIPAAIAGDMKAFLERGDAGTAVALAAVASGADRIGLGSVSGAVLTRGRAARRAREKEKEVVRASIARWLHCRCLPLSPLRPRCV